MSRFKLVMLYLTIGVSVILAVVAATYPILRMPDMPPHDGDGQFQNISRRFPWTTVGFPVAGYEIKFPPFDLSNDRELSYSIENLPSIGKTAMIYFCIEDPKGKLRANETRKNLHAAIAIEVIDEKGELVCEVKGPLPQMIWAYPEAGQNTYGLYSPVDSQFKTDEHERYRIRLRYSADRQLQGFNGFVYIRCGGSN